MGFLGLQMSHILMERKSLEAMYLLFLMNSALEHPEMNSVRKFFCPTDSSLKFTAVLSEAADILRSHILREPLLVPKRNRLSAVGCILLKLMFSLSSSIFYEPRMSATRKGLEGSSKFHRKAWTSSLERRYSSLLVEEMALMVERCLEGKVFCTCEE